MNPILKVSWSPKDFLVTSAGEPVWPARGEAEDALRAIAATFGASLAETDTTQGEVAYGGAEIVLGVGEENAHNARLYAHLTRRRARIVANLDESAELDGVVVVVCQWSQLGFAALDWIHSRTTTHNAVGLIVGHSSGSMRNQLLTRAAAACLPGTTDMDASMICADWSGTEEFIGSIHLLGAHAGAAALVSALSRGMSVISVNGHGDGLDIQLGAKETLCGIIGQNIAGLTTGIPDCVTGRYCYRSHLPLNEALSDEGGLVDPRLLRCRIGIFNSCFTIPARGALVHPQWSLLGRWLDSPSIGALIAPIGLSALSLAGSLELTEAILCEPSVGVALESFNRCKDVEAGRIRMCLFGDPNTCVPSKPLVHTYKGTRHGSGHHRNVPCIPVRSEPLPVEQRTKARSQLLLLVLGEARRTASIPDVVGLLDRATALIQEARTEDPTAICEAARAAVRGLLQGNAIWQIFNRLALPSEEVDGLKYECAACGERVRVHRLEFPVEGGLARLQGRCDRCGTTSDVEEGSPLINATFDLDGGRLVLPDNLRRPGVCLGLKLRPWHGMEVACELLLPPRDALEPGLTSTSVVALEPGLTSASVVALDALEIVFLRRQIRVEGSPRTPDA